MKKIISAAVGVVALFFYTGYSVANTTHQFEKYGFNLEVPEDVKLACYPDFMKTPADLGGREDGSGVFCRTPTTNTPFVQVGWKDRRLDNTTLNGRTITGLVKLFEVSGSGKWLPGDCNREPEIISAVQKIEHGHLAYSCNVTTDEGKRFKLIVYMFSLRVQPDTLNWISISDIANPGSATNEKMIQIVKGLRRP